MLPPSIARAATGPVSAGADRVERRVVCSPANEPAAVGAELRALLRWGALSGVVTVILLLGYAWVGNQVVEAGYRLSVTRQLAVRLERERRELLVRAAAADAPGRLEELAATRLGMRRPQRDEEGLLP